MAQIKCGILPIRIETGRFCQLCSEDTLCEICDQDEVEAEFNL